MGEIYLEGKRKGEGEEGGGGGRGGGDYKKRAVENPTPRFTMRYRRIYNTFSW
jgi:hypothetical protein